MERLTFKFGDKYAVKCTDVNENTYYDKNCKNAESYYQGKAIGKLAHYEDLKEKGLLVEIPCNYNDKMFWIVKGRIKEVFFKGIRCDKGYKPQIIARYMENLNMKEEPICKAESIGKTIFLTQSEAEQALKGRDDR